ncbi:MAG: hypothetical protein ABI647_11915 [Gemmatimonadota bacterium]
MKLLVPGFTQNDMVLAIKNANAAALAAGSAVDLIMPHGTHYWTGPLPPLHNVRLISLGGHVNYSPTVDGPALEWSNGTGQVYGAGCFNVHFYSPDTTRQKTMIKIVDATDFVVNRLRAYEKAWRGGAGFGSIGIHTCGRETVRVRDSHLYADQPVLYDMNPNFGGNVAADLFVLLDSVFVMTSGRNNKAVDCADGVIIQSLAIRHCAAVRGGGLFRLANTAVSGISMGLEFDNCRTEQSHDPASYAIDIASRPHVVHKVTVRNMICDPTANGLKLRNVTDAELDSIDYNEAAKGVFLNVDATVNSISGRDWTHGAATSFVGLDQVAALDVRNETWGEGTKPFHRLNKRIIRPGAGEISADRGDANVTLVVGRDAETQRFATALTAKRIVSLSTKDATMGDTWRIVRTGLGGFSLDIGGIKTIPAATAATVTVQYDGSAWRLVGYQPL